jgi:hypothetical protein
MNPVKIDPDGYEMWLYKRYHVCSFVLYLAAALWYAFAGDSSYGDFVSGVLIGIAATFGSVGNWVLEVKIEREDVDAVDQ